MLEGSSPDYMKFFNMTTRQFIDDAVVFANSNPDAKFEPNTVVLKDFSLKKMLEYITLKHSDYQFYYLIDSSVLLNGYRLFKLLASLLPQDDVMLGVQRKSFS